jgi:hypothetical protein
MKKSPGESKLEDILHSSRLVAGGFMGSDTRSASEIIEADAAELLRLGITAKQIAERMQEITNIAKTALGSWILVDDRRRAQVEEARGVLICPWGHLRKCDKRVTIVTLIESGETAQWSDLNIHLIAEHGFFEGKGSNYRLDPEKLAKIIF